MKQNLSDKIKICPWCGACHKLTECPEYNNAQEKVERFLCKVLGINSDELRD